MNLTRRSFLLGSSILGLAGGLSACGSTSPGSNAARGGEALSFWYWSGGLSDRVVKTVGASFASRARVTATLVDGDFTARLTTTLASRASVPDVTGVKGEDMPQFLAQADHFLDLNSLGARKVASSFAAAKYAQGTTRDGKQIGLPIDLGPTALFLRADLWARAGLPTDPGAVSALMSSWDGWFDVAARLKKALPATFAIRNSNDVFGQALAQQPETFVTRSGAFAGEGGGVKAAWDVAVRSITEGVTAGVYDDDAFNAALSAGTITGHIGPAWNGLDIASGAPGTSGSWRVASSPGGPANVGGSFLTLTSACREPELAFAYACELLSPANEARGFTDASIFPAVPAAYRLPALTRGQAFYGGQATIEVFGPAVANLPTVYDDWRNPQFSTPYVTELANIEGGKDPGKAWEDAVTAATLTAQKVL